ncbi:hypothetical protein [Streptomyces lydicus]|uniref:hypothetical protein n=1 Tax=Streptomyces lydicus TaxID=47763 RepID=UPI00342B76DA
MGVNSWFAQSIIIGQDRKRNWDFFFRTVDWAEVPAHVRGASVELNSPVSGAVSWSQDPRSDVAAINTLLDSIQLRQNAFVETHDSTVAE